MSGGGRKRRKGKLILKSRLIWLSCSAAADRSILKLKQEKMRREKYAGVPALCFQEIYLAQSKYANNILQFHNGRKLIPPLNYLFCNKSDIILVLT